MDEQLFQQKLRSTLLPAWEQLPDFGLYMDQVMTYAEKCFAGVAEAEQKLMTPAMMNNYVKGGLVDRPVGKKYSRDSQIGISLPFTGLMAQTPSICTPVFSLFNSARSKSLLRAAS